MATEDKEENGWKPLAFRAETVIPLPPRPHPAAFVLRFLDQVLRGGLGVVAPQALAKLGEAVGRCDAGDLEASLRMANHAAADEPSLRPLALIVARMCVKKEIERHRAALVTR